MDRKVNIVQWDHSGLLADTDNNFKAEKRWGEDGMTQLRILIMRSVDWTQEMTKVAGAWREAWRIPKLPSEIGKEAFCQDQLNKGTWYMEMTKYEVM